MKFSASLFLCLAFLCASAVSNPHINTKHKTNQNGEGNKKVSHSIKPTIDESKKSTNEPEEDTLTWAIERLAPLAQAGFEIGTELASRIINGDNFKKASIDSHLLARTDKLIAEASGVYKSLTGQGLEIKISDEPKKPINSGAEILSTPNEKKAHVAGNDRHLRSDLRKHSTRKASDGNRKRAYDKELLDKVSGLLDKATAAADDDTYSQSVGTALSQALSGKRLKKLGV